MAFSMYKSLLMSQRSHKESSRKYRPLIHKTTKSLPLHKYSIKRTELISQIWPSEAYKAVPRAYDISNLSKTMRAYLEVSDSERNFRKISIDRSYSKQEIEVETEIKETESYCNCNQPYIQGELMFKCEGFCGNWYHPHCLKMKNEEIDRQKNSNVRWYCPKCIKKAMEVMNECYDTQPSKSRTATIG